ncbi:hypothetical protein CDAR_205121 [Caerostris darwini]|uniref:Uncharacterized protein n=1 Tax=Caerostris darwini TaxID=1538125 RepID=A0AAV4PVJ1_9ARAC|nr:hypothetical protein CDAR_205121 [Caerostris darwini]
MDHWRFRMGGGGKGGWSNEIETVVTVPRKECAPPLSSICQTLCPVSHFFLYPGGDPVRKKKFDFKHPRSSKTKTCVRILSNLWRVICDTQNKTVENFHSMGVNFSTFE